MRTGTRAVILVLAVGVLLIGFFTVAGSAPGGKGKFTACPQPPCMQLCNPEAPPEVVCKGPDGGTFQTTYACCCCGGSAGYSFKPLR